MYIYIEEGEGPLGVDCSLQSNSLWLVLGVSITLLEICKGKIGVVHNTSDQLLKWVHILMKYYISSLSHTSDSLLTKRIPNKDIYELINQTH